MTDREAENFKRLSLSCLGLILGTLCSVVVMVGAAAIADSASIADTASKVFDFLPLTLLALALTMPAGIVLHAILYSLRKRSLIYYSLMGFAGGILVSFILIRPSLGSGEFAFLAISGGLGVVCASVAWLIRRPDKDLPKALP